MDELGAVLRRIDPIILNLLILLFFVTLGLIVVELILKCLVICSPFWKSRLFFYFLIFLSFYFFLCSKSRFLPIYEYLLHRIPDWFGKPKKHFYFSGIGVLRGVNICLFSALSIKLRTTLRYSSVFSRWCWCDASSKITISETGSMMIVFSCKRGSLIITPAGEKGWRIFLSGDLLACSLWAFL